MPELTFSTWKCMKKNCNLTALWQCGVDVVPRWAVTHKPLHCVFSLVLCGLCKELVSVSDLSGFQPELERNTGRPFSDFNITLAFYDISDGYWVDPRNATDLEKKVRMPNSLEDYTRSINHPEGEVEIQDVDLFGGTD